MLIGALSFPMYAQPRMTFAGSSSSAHSTTRASSATRIEGSMPTAKIERAKCTVTALAVSFSSARPTLTPAAISSKWHLTTSSSVPALSTSPAAAFPAAAPRMTLSLSMGHFRFSAAKMIVTRRRSLTVSPFRAPLASSRARSSSFAIRTWARTASVGKRK